MREDVLSPQQEQRYARQISLPSVDFVGQEKLQQAHVAVIGIGGLGCAAAQYLAAAGIGQLTLVDFDVVELSNLQRQVLHQTPDIGINKAESAAQLLRLNNPEIDIKPITQKLDNDGLASLIQQCDVIVDCTDNLETRQQLNRLCFIDKIPLVSAAAIRLEGMVTVFDYETDSPCYQCFSQLFGEQQLSCLDAGVLAPSVGIIGAIESTEAIKLIVGIGEPLVGRLLLGDFSTMSFREMKLKKSNTCAVCNT
ncbi:MAG: molybdopterin-synthase adenylyltransferase MoeB [Psychrobium sp.]